MALLGVFGALYYNSKWYDQFPDYYTNPNWVEVPLAQDVRLIGTSEEIEITPRGNGGYRAVDTINVDMTVEFGLLHVPYSDQHVVMLYKLLDSWMNHEPLELLMLEADIGTPNVRGVRLPVFVSEATKREELGGAQSWDCRSRQTLYPTQETPGWYGVS